MAADRFRVWVERMSPSVELPDDVVLVSSLDDADGAVVGAGDLWNSDACRRFPRLKVVARSGIGYDNVLVGELAEHGVAVCNAPDAPTVSTAEHALALMLGVTKNLVPNALRLRAGLGDYALANRGVELAGLTLGLVGCGRIGARVGRYCEALGMTVLVSDPFVARAVVGTVVDLDELWARSDVVSLHAPATPETRHLVDRASLAKMKPGVVIVNCARGSLVDHDALLAALETGHVFGAGLDVTEPEPLPVEHPLLHRDDVIVTPHVASSTTVGKVRLVEHALDEVVTWLRGGLPVHLLDASVLDPALDRRRRC
jgi:phosphoglycerate dehydrogenase-like enzyme